LGKEPTHHAVVGFVLGAFGELSNICYSLCTAIARAGAARVVSFWKIPPKHALALFMQKILRFWGLKGLFFQSKRNFHCMVNYMVSKS
jgi:hypothetical protein